MKLFKQSLLSLVLALPAFIQAEISPEALVDLEGISKHTVYEVAMEYASGNQSLQKSTEDALTLLHYLADRGYAKAQHQLEVGLSDGQSIQDMAVVWHELNAAAVQ